MSWKAGDDVYFAPTNLQAYHHEYRVIAEYLPDSGKLTVTEPFEFYHNGGDSSFDKYGVDMRAEVINLTRNVRVVGDDVNDWGCTILNSDRVEADRSIRVGRMTLDNVEVLRGGQEDTYKAGIRYEGSKMADVGENLVRGTTVWGGNAKPLVIKTSVNVRVEDSAFIGGYQLGVLIQSS